MEMNNAPTQPSETDAAIIAKQVASWRKEIARLNDLIAFAVGVPARQQEQSADVAIERAAVICESFCASDDNEEGINFILRQRAQRIRGLKSADPAAPGASTEDEQ